MFLIFYMKVTVVEKMDTEHCKSIWEIIKDYNDDICYGYAGRSDCAKFF